MRNLAVIGSVMLAATLLAACAGAAPRQSGQAAGSGSQAASGVSFAGKTITLLLGQAPGGPTDLYDRVLARYLPAHLPGNPTVVVQNQVGAGGILVDNTLYNQSKPDGLTLMGNTDPESPWLLKDPSVQYDLLKFTWLGAVADGEIAYVRTDTGVKTVADLKTAKVQLVLGGRSRSSSNDLLNRLFLRLIGVSDFKYITGYGGAAAFNQAMRSGEVNYGSDAESDYQNSVDPMVKGNVVTPIAQTGLVDTNGQIVPDSFSSLPTEVEAIKQVTGSVPSGTDYDAMVMMASTHKIQRAFVLPPNTPDNIASAWRKAFADTFEDAAFKADVKKQFGLDIPLVNAEDSQKVIANMAAAAEQKPAAIQLLKQMGAG
jgi:tripartite-type tricarboxylate transporter receptor subunit TctC